MRKGLFAGGYVLLAFAVSGCSQPGKHEAVFKGMVEQMNALADALESVKDRASASSAAKKINKICDRLKELGKEAEVLPRISKDEEDRLLTQYDPDIKKAFERLQAAAQKAAVNSAGDPDFLKAAGRLEEVGKDFEKLEKK